MFSSIQLVGLYVFTLFIAYCTLSKIMDLIEYTRYTKMWIKYYETIKSSDKWYTIPKPTNKNNEKEEKEDDHNENRKNEEIGGA